MDKETLVRYSPIAVIVIALILQWNMFATPTDVEKKHREILNEVGERYMTKEQATDFRIQLNDMQNKIDKIYDVIITSK
jgi:uncharacterized protein YjaG (DUF416 family)